METVVIVIHLMVIVALVAVVLMQRSEGGALGIGGGSNFLSTRSQGNISPARRRSLLQPSSRRRSRSP